MSTPTSLTPIILPISPKPSSDSGRCTVILLATEYVYEVTSPGRFDIQTTNITYSPGSLTYYYKRVANYTPSNFSGWDSTATHPLPDPLRSNQTGYDWISPSGHYVGVGRIASSSWDQTIGYEIGGTELGVAEFINSLPSNNYANFNGRDYRASSTWGVHPFSTCPIWGVPPNQFPLFIYLGTAAPPPPPPKNMNCCDCNTIATIVESQMMAQLLAEQKLFEELKDHIDKRSLEIIIKDLEHLRALDFEEFLKAVIKRINEVESNLWNGAKQ